MKAWWENFLDNFLVIAAHLAPWPAFAMSGLTSKIKQKNVSHYVF